MKKVTKTIILILVCFNCFSQSEISRKLSVFQDYTGKWSHETHQIPFSGNTVVEHGEANLFLELSSTYLTLDVSLNTESGSTRHYKQLITYSEDQNHYISRYLYSNTSVMVEEFGVYDSKTNTLSFAGINPWASQLENGINIKTSLAFKNNKILLEVNELRPNGTWEIGYRSLFTR